MKSKSDSTSRYILIVDRDSDTRIVLKRILEALGFNVFEAGSSQVATACIQREPPVLILLDLMMRNMEGFSILNMLNQQSHTRQIPVIALIPYSASETQALDLPGISAVLRKGRFTSVNLMKLIHRYLIPTGRATASAMRPLSIQPAASNMLHITLAPSLVSAPIGD